MIRIFLKKQRSVSLLVFGTFVGLVLCSGLSLNVKTYLKNNNESTMVWKEGFLDIHHINTGKGDATFFIFPDGTTMLFDIGDMDVEKFNKNLAPLKATSAHPSDSLTAAQWIVNYIRQVLPEERALKIDYAVISHFHADHYGEVTLETPEASNGKYKLTGITELGDIIPIQTIIDRGAPDYDYPLDLKEYYNGNQTFENYQNFIEYQFATNGLSVEALRPGKSDQITLLNDPKKYLGFYVKNIKSNGTIWTGNANETFEYLNRDSIINQKGKFNENPLSLALKISYGEFDYFTGGDLTGMQMYGKPAWFDVETPVAKAVGEVEVMTLNHHGNRDATNLNFVQGLSPQVAIQQSWCSDHPGQEVFHRLDQQRKIDIYATNIHEETTVAYGPWFTKAYASMEGHVMIRVMPGGREWEIMVFEDEKADLKLKEKPKKYKSY